MHRFFLYSYLRCLSKCYITKCVKKFKEILLKIRKSVCAWLMASYRVNCWMLDFSIDATDSRALTRMGKFQTACLSLPSSPNRSRLGCQLVACMQRFLTSINYPIYFYLLFLVQRSISIICFVISIQFSNSRYFSLLN